MCALNDGRTRAREGNPGAHSTPSRTDLSRDIWNPLRLFIDWATHETSAKTLGQAIKAVGSRGYTVDEWETLTTVPLNRLADPSVKGVDALLDKWIEDLDQRDSTVFVERIAPVSGRRRTLESIGSDLGYTRERIRQLEKIIRERLYGFVESEAGRPLRWRIDSVSHYLGVAAPIESVDAYMGSYGESKYVDLIIELAGPYAQSNGWLILKSALAGDPTSRIKDVTDKYGRIDMRSAADLLSQWGLDQHYHRQFLIRDKKIRTFKDQLVRWDGPITNKIALALDHLKRPASAEELLEVVKQRRNVRSVKNALASDSRFIRTSRTEWALVDWGLEEYSNIVSMIARFLANADNPVHIDEVAEDISCRFNVAESSVRSFCGAAPVRDRR